MTLSLTTRLFDARDAPHVVALINEAFNGDGAGNKGWTHEAEVMSGNRMDEQRLAMIMAPETVQFLVFEHPECSQSGGLAACVMLKHLPETCEAYIGQLSVSLRFQGKGLGNFVLQRAEEWAAQRWGVTGTTMTVLNRRPELLQWYSRKGYTETGKIEPYHAWRLEGGRQAYFDDLMLIHMAKRLG
ncbi:acyl-CoA N-acyltransferase [Chytriomyces sp. MP71]|nr:acyl-CoA N-acyltransferase [Chytriomyces sp. MP71]